MNKPRKLKRCKYCDEFFLPQTNRQMYCSHECANSWKSIYGFHYTKKPYTEKDETLCWNCRKARADMDCSWANKYEPVEGWETTSTSINMGGGKIQESFKVTACPLFLFG